MSLLARSLRVVATSASRASVLPASSSCFSTVHHHASQLLQQQQQQQQLQLQRPPHYHHLSWPSARRFSSTTSDGAEAPDGAAAEDGAAAAEGAGDEAAEEEAAAEVSPTAALEKELAEAQQSAKDAKDQMLRALADAENARTIARRDVENATNFAVTKFAKSLLEVADNLSLAIDSIPAEEVESNATLKTFMEGVDMTDKLLSKSFAQHGLTKFGERGDKFDPNLHDALFQLQDPELEEGQIGQVLKPGYQLKERVIRPAQVGTVRK